MSKTLLFSGQGSQYVGMLKDIYEKYPEAQLQIDKANEILAYNLKSILFDGPAETLRETQYTQPALFLHSAVVFDLIKSKLVFNAVAGHSVGEYAALYAAGVISFEDGLKLVSTRGKLMFNAGTQEQGTMFAIINLDDAKLIEVCKKLTENGNGNVVVAANFNSPGQVVVSGSAEYLRQNASAFKEAGAKLVKELSVSGAFHSPLMQSAKEELAIAIENTNFNNANVPVYVNVNAQKVTDAIELKTKLIEQLVAPVMWTQTLLNMQNDGISYYTEIGAGNVLQGLVKRTLTSVEIDGFDKATDVEKIF